MMSVKPPARQPQGHGSLVCAGTRAEECFVEDVCELLSELSISLFGQPMTAQDILTAEIQPDFGDPLRYLVSYWRHGSHLVCHVFKSLETELSFTSSENAKYCSQLLGKSEESQVQIAYNYWIW